MGQYAKTAVDNTKHLGSVTGRQVSQYVLDIDATVDRYAVEGADEIIIRLNGRPLKRMTVGQAERAGIIGGA
jgi:hypothetical protein